MFQDEFNWQVNHSQFKNVKFVKVDPSVMNKIRSMDDESRKLDRELGGIGCFDLDQQGERITLKNLIEVRPNMLHSTSYEIFHHEIQSAGKVYCNDEKSILLHTHPDGSKFPSDADRINSVGMDHVGCVIARGDVTCFFGDKMLYPLS